MKSPPDQQTSTTDELTGGDGLLAADEPPAYRLVNASGTCPLVLVCDHASNRVPRSLNNLGLTADVLVTHIGWDPGAERVALGLAAKLNAPLLLSNYSRLVVDCNRPPASPESIPLQSAGVVIPGNQNLSGADRKLRMDTLFYPYQRAIEQLLNQRAKDSVLLSIHSFTPNLNGENRPWQMGVACYHDERLAQALYTVLVELTQSIDGWQIGFNEPYAIETEFDYTVPIQGESRGIPCAMVEMRQDMIADDRGVEQLVDLLASALSQSIQ